MEVLFVLLLVPIAVLGLCALALWVLWKGLKGLAWLLRPLVRGVGALFGHVLGTLWNLVRDALQSVGALATALLVMPLVPGNLLLGRTRAAKHYARACEDELLGFFLGLYRVAISHPLRLVGLGAALDVMERRLPDVIDREPGSPGVRRPDFPGYDVLGSLPTGGSGADLFLAEPTRETRGRWGAAGRELPERVVIKSFALERGSTLPQIVRESRALEAAGRLGLVYDHELSEGSFWYVMKYVAGEELGQAVQRLHDRAGAAGLPDKALRRVVWWSRSLVGTLDRFHAGGLWHKDIKPSNIIVDDARLHVVDFGLVTPLASSMTLTTHGTEFYRDPELVRLAMQGVKVHEVDGVKFDLFSAGAVIYSMLENSFPAQGSLSRFSRRAPEALQWIVRRAMAEIDQRYGSAGEMLADLAALDAAEDPWALRPADLPSNRGPYVRSAVADGPVPLAFAAATPPRPQARPRPVPTQPRPPTRSAGQRRRRRAVAAATLLGLGVVGGVALTARAVQSRRHANVRAFRPAVVQASERADTPRLYPAEREAWELAHEALDVVQRERTSTPAARPALVVSQSAGSSAQRHDSGQRPLHIERELDGPLVILADVGAPVPRAALAELEARLVAAGVDVLGADPDEIAQDDELTIAAAHHVAGLSGLGDDDACARLVAWLAEHPELGGILWVAATDEQDRFRYRVLTPTAETAAPTCEQQHAGAPGIVGNV